MIRRILSIVACGLLALPGAAYSQAYPSKPVRVIVSTVPGPLDTFARMICDKLAAAMKGLQVDTPLGKITYRAIDHQSTMGAYVGKIGLKDGKGVMTSWSG